MTYEIRENATYNSREVYFDGKPAEAVREALKALKMRWHSVKKCWYGYADEHALVAAILGTNTDDAAPETMATVVTDGYLGGGAVYGSKSNRHLYGAELSAAVRADLKAAGVKGVSVRCKTYSGGQSLEITLKTTAADVLSLAEYIEVYRVRPAFGRIYTDCGDISDTDYYSMDAAQQEEVRQRAARYDYRREVESECSINHYHMDEYQGFSEAGRKKLETVQAIVEAYRYDESNSMVDYFDTNFYYDITTKPTK